MERKEKRKQCRQLRWHAVWRRRQDAKKVAVAVAVEVEVEAPPPRLNPGDTAMEKSVQWRRETTRFVKTHGGRSLATEPTTMGGRQSYSS